MCCRVAINEEDCISRVAATGAIVFDIQWSTVTVACQHVVVCDAGESLISLVIHAMCSICLDKVSPSFRLLLLFFLVLCNLLSILCCAH
jgi:hypothetical protein